jgi:hypothetical protein
MTRTTTRPLARPRSSYSASNLVDVSIEFSHVDVGSYDASDVARSGQKASQIATLLTEQSKTFSVALLIDDKNSAHQITSNDVSVLIHEASNWLPVNYVVFESRLADYKLDLFECIEDSHRVAIRKQVDRYEAKSGRLACSHDIAIWHLLRLGIITPDASTVVPVVSGDRFTTRPFFSRSVVSILSKEDREAEEKAMSDILRFSKDESVASKISLAFV